MDWVTTIDAKAACPISTPPPEPQGLRLAGWEPPDDDELSAKADEDYTAAECARLRELVDSQYAELEQLRVANRGLHRQLADAAQQLGRAGMPCPYPGPIGPDGRPV